MLLHLNFMDRVGEKRIRDARFQNMRDIPLKNFGMILNVCQKNHDLYIFWGDIFAYSATIFVLVNIVWASM